MSLIWQKGAVDVDERIMRFMAGEDVILDRQLFLYDIQASKAHVKGLASIDLMSQQEATDIERELDALAEAFSNGDFVLDEQFEDMHSAIEAWLTDKLGETGKRVHTGRSRNDQVLVAVRLYLKDVLQQLVIQSKKCAEVCLERAAEYEKLPMPGYTHLQRAVVSSGGMWFAGFAEGFIDNAQILKDTLAVIDSNPLGTAAGYGVNLPLNRELTTEELGFGRMQVNPIYTQNSRGKYEIQAMMAASQCLLDARRFAWDLSLFTTSEFDFVELPDRYTTGSSIMPNKRNPDFVELLRASFAPMQGAINELMSLLSVPSGYQRDLQFGKGPLLKALNHAVMVMELLPDIMQHMKFNEEKCRAAISVEMYATDRAMELAAEKVPFRDAYRQVVSEYDLLAQRTPEGSLSSRVSPGGCANLELKVLEERLSTL